MDELGPRGFWTNMVVQRPVMETNSVRSPTAVLRGPPDDPTQMVAPAPRSCQSDGLLDGKKIGATLLVTGVLLALVGIIFTVMGWHHYLANLTFEWTQLLGPILISVGGTFMLTSVCKFGIIFCWPCRQWDEEVHVMPVMEPTSTGHSLMLSGINQSIMLQGATTMLCIPPVCNFRTQELRPVVEFQPGRSVNGAHAAIPSHGYVYCVDNVAFTAEEDSSDPSADTDHKRSRTEKTEDTRGRDDDSGSASSRPPAYEDVYPSFNKRNLT